MTQFQPATTERAIENCGDAIVGSGQFWAHIVLPGQAPYATHGRLLVFNGARRASRRSSPTSTPPTRSRPRFVIPFSIHHLRRRRLRDRLAPLPQALGDWGFVDRIKLTLRRKYQLGGKQTSYFNANCPAAPGTRSAIFPLASADFAFGDKSLSLQVTKSCGVKGE